MTHPGIAKLALYAGRDCSRLEQWRIQRHLKSCAACRAEVQEFLGAQDDLRAYAAEMPAGLNWRELSEEMRGNIRVGLAAGECVGDFPVKRRAASLRHWNIATSLGALAVLFVAAFLTYLPEAQTAHMAGVVRHFFGMRPPLISAGTILEASPQQIEVRSNGTAMTMVPSNSSDVTVSVSLQGSASERVVDGETGQVTISQVYYAQP